jgi:hypothetical protein
VVSDPAGQVLDHGECHRNAWPDADCVCGECFALHPNWGGLVHQVTAPAIPEEKSAATYWYFAIALFGAAMTPYEVFFFSSGAVEKHWTTKDLGTARLNVIIGVPLGGLLSIAIAACATIVPLPSQIDVTSLSQTVMPVVAAGGKLLVAFAIVGIVAATFGAALETTLSGGYVLAQFLGWPWGKFRRPAEAARFHVVMIVTAPVMLVALLRRRHRGHVRCRLGGRGPGRIRPGQGPSRLHPLFAGAARCGLTATFSRWGCGATLVLRGGRFPSRGPQGPRAQEVGNDRPSRYAER